MDTDFEFENPILDILFAEDKEPQWVIPEMLLQGAAVIMAGDAGAGKSYVSYTVGLAIAAGCSALSGIVPEGETKRVLYFDQENSVQDRDRYITRSWRGLQDSKGNPPDPALLHENFYPVHFALGDDDWFEVAAKYVEQLAPHLIVFDTATPCFNILDENSNAEATRAMKQVRKLMAITEPTATALILKHAKVTDGKGGPRFIRGAKAWKGAADLVMFQVKSQGRPRRGGLNLTRLVPDKARAYGLSNPIYITPSYTDEKKTGLVLEASYEPNREHRARLSAEEGDDEE